MRRVVPIAMVAVLAALAAWAGPAPGGPPRGMGPKGFGPAAGRGPGAPLHEHLFPAELVLKNQTALGLTADQLATIKAAMKESQGKTLDIRVDLQRVQEKLEAILEPNEVDAAAALAAGDEAMALEARVKKTHLSMLIAIKNALTDDQIAKLREMRPPRPPEPPQPLVD